MPFVLLKGRLEEYEQARTRGENAVDAALSKAKTNKDPIEELQTRELKKEAHLLETNVYPHEIDVDGDHLEKIRTDDDRLYYRLPDSEDPLQRSAVSLAHDDLLPVQQLARIDEEMPRSTTNALPSRLAPKLWKARTDPTTGDPRQDERSSSRRHGRLERRTEITETETPNTVTLETGTTETNTSDTPTPKTPGVHGED